ncbi:uncharacterized protein LOC111615758 [Centruroides sculpturatus]|uniref:uncharacterized protein LOC111615758 n=1 Tax=Centruroides sculpturatus TaxID=218467 RepID=UPI000C6EE3D9|nr:uncharacterized protein LOC111615758 [Centruroides sculpturatus]
MHQYLVILLLKSFICENIADVGIIESSNYQIRNVKSVEYKLTSAGMQLVIEGKIYRLTLQKEKSNLFESAKIFIHREEKVEILRVSNIPQSYIYVGSLGGPSGELIIGYYFENMFIGILKHGKKIFYVEPRNEYFHDTNDKSGIIYEIKDVILKPFYPDGRMTCEAMRTESHHKMKSPEDYHFDFKMPSYNFLVNNNLRIRLVKQDYDLIHLKRFQR